MTAVNAATISVQGSYGGGQLGDVAFDLTVSNDFSGDIADTTVGLTVNSLSSSVVGDPFIPDGGLAYRYTADVDAFSIGGLNLGVFGLFGDATDFLITICSFTGPSPVLCSASDTTASSSGITGFLTDDGFTAVVSSVPISAGFPLLLTGLAGMAGLRMRKKRA